MWDLLRRKTIYWKRDMPTKNWSQKAFVRDSWDRKRPSLKTAEFFFCIRPAVGRKIITMATSRFSHQAIYSKGKARTTDGSRAIHEGPAEVWKGAKRTVSRAKRDDVHLNVRYKESMSRTVNKAGRSQMRRARYSSLEHSCVSRLLPQKHQATSRPGSK